MIDTSTSTAAPADDLFATRDPQLVAGRGYAWSSGAKPLGGAHGRLRLGLYLYIAVMAFNLIVVAAMMYIFLQFQNPSASFETDGAIAILSSIVEVGGTYLPYAVIGAFAICVITYLWFVYRAMKNLHQSNARGVSVGPGWAVGWSFIPFANLGMIPSVMRQIWTASHDPSRGAASPPFVTIVWWATYLIGGFIGRISETLSPKETDLQFMQPEGYFDAFLPGSIATAAGSILLIASCACLLTIIRQINDAQEALRTTSAFDE